MSQTPRQLIVASSGSPRVNQNTGTVQLLNADGTPFKQGAAVASPAALTQAAITGGEAPTEAEFNALRTDHSNTRTVVTNLLTSLRAAGLIDT